MVDSLSEVGAVLCKDSEELVQRNKTGTKLAQWHSNFSEPKSLAVNTKVL